MTKTELDVVRKHLLKVYAMYHKCGLTPKEVTRADKARGLKVGQACDDCQRSAEWHIQEIIKETGD
jgi:hypothetical protein